MEKKMLEELQALKAQLGEKVANDYWIAPITLDTVKHYADVWLQCGEYTKPYIIALFHLFILNYFSNRF